MTAGITLASVFGVAASCAVALQDKPTATIQTASPLLMPSCQTRVVPEWPRTRWERLHEKLCQAVAKEVRARALPA
jgi:hypothetical protein